MKRWTQEERDALARYYQMRAYALETLADIAQCLLVILVLWLVFG